MESLRLPAAMESLEILRSFVIEMARRSSVDREKILKIELILEELLLNIIKYAYPEEKGNIEIGCFLEDDGRFRIILTDWGIPFNPLEHAAPDTTLRISERKPGGLGIHMVKNLADELKYEYRSNCNELTVSIRV